jgi:short-subunit dehydrogenase
MAALRKEHLMTNENKGTALITGASSGIGAIYADRLARRGHDLILLARNQDRLQALAKRLKGETGRSVEIIAADLTTDLRKVEERLKTDASISMLINNAGVGAKAPLLGSDITKMDDMIALNVSVLTRLVYAALPVLLRAAKERSSTSRRSSPSRRKC